MNNKQFFEGSLFLNRDCDWCSDWWIDSSSKEAMKKSLEFGFSTYAGDSITDVCFNVNGQSSYIPTKEFDWSPMYYIEYAESYPDWAKRFEPY